MSITCPDCLMTSHHPKDEEEGYCGVCNDFTKDARKREIQALEIKVLPDGRELSVVRTIFNARLNIGPAGSPFIDDFYCYESEKKALAALADWDGQGDPGHEWHRHGRTGRRRPDGDPAMEYVNP